MRCIDSPLASCRLAPMDAVEPSVRLGASQKQLTSTSPTGRQRRDGAAAGRARLVDGIMIRQCAAFHCRPRERSFWRLSQPIPACAAHVQDYRSRARRRHGATPWSIARGSRRALDVRVPGSRSTRSLQRERIRCSLLSKGRRAAGRARGAVPGAESEVKRGTRA
jgi:hypothetical protein